MLFALLFTVFSFKIIKSNQEVLPDTSKSVVIQNSNFQSRQFSSSYSKYRSNKLSNALVSNSNFKFKGSKDHSLLLQLVNFNNNTIELDEDFESSPVEVQSGESTIYNLTLKNLQYKDNDVAIFSFDNTDIQIVKLKCKGKLKSTLFKGPVTGFSLTDSFIEGFQKDNKHQIRSAIFLSHLECSDTNANFVFDNNTFQHNEIPVFELDKNINNNVTVSKCTFYHNVASSGSCILISYQSGASNTGKINIDSNTFKENSNHGVGLIGGALMVNTQQTVFKGDNYFEKNDCFTDGSSGSGGKFGGYGASIYLTQSRLVPYTLQGLHFKDDTSSHGGSLFIYAYDEKGQTQGNTVSVKGCSFTHCHSDQFGGAITSGIQKENGESEGNNDVSISDCNFDNCDAGTGGAIYVSLGSGPGGESTVIHLCKFTNCNCNGRLASAIYSGSIEFTLTDCTFTNQGKSGETNDGSIIGLGFKDKSSKSLISKCTFNDCYQAVIRMSDDSDKTNPVMFEDCSFTSNKVFSAANSYRGLFDLSYMNSVPLSLTNCNFTQNNGFCVLGEKGICKTTFNNCEFKQNTATFGCIFYVTRNSATEAQEYITFIDSKFVNHEFSTTSGRATGVLRIPLSFVRFDGTNTFSQNKAVFNGQGTSKQNCAMGGSILFEASSDKESIISNLVFEDSSSTSYGGAIAVFYDSTSKIKLGFTFENCQFKKCNSNTGGAVYLDDNDKVQYELGIDHCTFNECSSPNGCSIYCQIFKLDLSHSVFDKMSEGESIFYVKLIGESGETKVTNCTFTNNKHRIEFGSSSSGLPSGSSITFSKCNFKDNQGGGVNSLFELVNVKAENINFDECTFDHNGYQCINQESDEIISNVHVNKCTFSNNFGVAGCAICTLTGSKDHKMIVEDCKFIANKPTEAYVYSLGAVIAYSNSIEFKGTNTFKQNAADYGSGDESSEKIMCHGGSLTILQNDPEEYVVSNLIFENSHSKHFAGAIAIFAGDFNGHEPSKKSAFVRIENCQFTSCTSGKKGGAIRCGMEFSENESDEDKQFDNDVNISGCTFTKCSSPQGGALYFQDGDQDGDEETIIQYCKFNGCVGSTGSAVLCRSYKCEILHSTFSGSRIKGEITEVSDAESVLFVELNELDPIIRNCTFTDNEQIIEAYSQSFSQPTRDRQNIIKFDSCTFNKNNQESNGNDPVIDLCFMLASLISFENCLFEENKGQCISDNLEEFLCSILVKNCTFNKNSGGNGCAIFVHDVTFNPELCVTVEDCVFSKNTVTSTYQSKGVIFADTLSIRLIGYNQFIENQAIIESEDPEQQIIAEGGSLCINQHEPAEYTLSNLTFTNSHSDGIGGAIMLYSGDIEGKPTASKSLFITIENCTFVGCSAGKQGGAINCGNSLSDESNANNDVRVTNCHFISCQAPEGGALYFIDGNEEGDEETVIEYCTFEGCLGGAGSAILCRSYKYSLSHSIFNGSREFSELPEKYETQSFLFAELNEDGVTIAVTNCTFYDNEQKVEFYSVNGAPSGSPDKHNSIIFKACNFSRNNKFQSNSADTSLDLQYMISESLLFEKCIFEENGGRCISQEGTVYCSTTIKNCTFNNNQGGSGSCIFSYDLETPIDHQITVQDCIFSNNKASFMGMEKGGAIYADTLSLRFAGVNQFINNVASYSDGETESTYSANGGSLFINQNQPAEYKLSNLIFINSYSDGYGGALTLWSGDLEDSDKPSATSLFITIDNCTFTNCSAYKNGGAIKCGSQQRLGDGNKFNDVSITKCKFEQCRSVAGGALYFMDGDKDGDEETVIKHCTFDGCVAHSGSAIFCRSYKFEMSHSIFRNLTMSNIEQPEGEAVPPVESLLCVIMNEAGVSPKVTNCTFFNNGQGIVFLVNGGTVETESNEIIFTQCNFSQNGKDGISTDGIFNFEYVMSTLITIDDCTFEDNFACCISQGNDVIVDSLINKCKFNRNTGVAGCAISATRADEEHQHHMAVKDCTFSYNKPTISEVGFFGPVIAYSNSIKFEGTNTFESNEANYNQDDLPDDRFQTFGGSLTIIQDTPEEYIVSNLIFKNSYSQHYGGAIGLMAGDYDGSDESKKNLFVRIENCQFINCSAGKQGGAIRCGMESQIDDEIQQFDNDVNISFCTFTQCKAPEAGALYFQDGDEEGDEETIIGYCTFDGCIGYRGSAIMCRSYKFSLLHSTIRGSRPYDKPPSDIEVESFLFGDLNEDGVIPLIKNCTFTDNEQNIEFYSINASPTRIKEDDDYHDKSNVITFDSCTFTKNNQASNGADTILNLEFMLSETLLFEKCKFEQNGGRCISQESDVTCNTLIKECTFNKNSGGSGCCIYSVENSFDAHPYITVESCVFSNNKADFYGQERGIVCAETLSIQFKGYNKFINNEIKHVSEDPEFKPQSMGGSIFLSQRKPAEYSIENITFTNSYSAGYGGALHIFAGDVENTENPTPSSLFITVKNCTFTDCTSGIQGGALRMGDPKTTNPEDTKDNDIKVTECKFIRCKSPEGGALYFMDGDVDGDEETVVDNCEFNGCIGKTGSAIYCQSYKFELRYTRFHNSVKSGDEIETVLFIYLNEAGIQPVISHCHFYNNEHNIEVQSHGPIAIEGGPESTVTFSECIFLENNKESNGDDSIVDLELIQSALVTFEKCTFEKNSGHCIVQRSEYVCKTLIKECVFNANHGQSGCAIYSATTRQDNIPMMTVDSCVFANNTVTSTWGARGGAVCASTITILFIGVNQFIANEVIYESSERAVPNIYMGACGGAIYLIQETDLRFELRDAQFSESKAQHYGGAIAIAGLEDENLFHRLQIDIIGCKFSRCTATYGSAIGSTIEGTIKAEACQFDSCTAESGGAIYCSDESTDTPSVLEVKSSSFNNIKASDAGGAVYVQSGAIFIGYNNFTNCEANKKGSALFINADVNATFENNNFEMTKKQGVSAIYYTSENEKSVMWLDGGCYSTTKSGQDSTADILVIETKGQIQFKNKPCFSGTKEESIQIIGNQALNLPDDSFNCHECQPIIVPPTPTFTIPTFVPTVPPTPTSLPVSPGASGVITPDINGTDSTDKGAKKKGLSTGAIVGIIIGVLVFVAIVVIVIIFIMRSRVNKNDIRSEQISQDADNSAYALESRMSTNEDENQPIWAANSMDANGIQENVDPFMKDFEEAVV